MSTYVKTMTDAGDQYLAKLADMQENFLKTASEFVTRFTASMPSMEAPAAFAASIPTAQEVTEANFAFAQKLLKQQKSFTEKLVATTTAATPAASK